MKSRVLIALLAAFFALPVLAAAPPDGLEKRLADEQVEQLVEAALAVRAELVKSRTPQVADLAERLAVRAEAQEKAQRQMATFLAVAGLSPDEFVRLVDADGGLDNGKPDAEPPQLRTLERAGEK